MPVPLPPPVELMVMFPPSSPRVILVPAMIEVTMPVTLEASIAGRVPVNCAEGTFVKPDPEPVNDDAVKAPP